MIDNAQLEKIQGELFKDPSLNVYAVIDGAAVKDLRFKLWEMQPEYCCLWAGKLEPDMEEVAPYLVVMKSDSAFLNWIIGEFWEGSAFILMKSRFEFSRMRRFVRRLLTVKSEGGSVSIFRFYDPRVMDDFFSVINKRQRDLLFEGVSEILTENGDFINIYDASKT